MACYFILFSVERKEQKEREREREGAASPLGLSPFGGQPFFKWPANERVSAFAKV